MAELADNGLNRKIADAASVAKEIDALEAEIAELRTAYEQFFLGLERKPPTLRHNELKKKIQRLRGAFVRQTAIKFRINALQQKFATYERLWSRTLTEIENGTYRRDLFKARLHKKKQDGPEEKKDAGPRVNELPSPEEVAQSLDEVLSEVEISPPAPGTPAQPVAAARAASAAVAGAARPGTPAAGVAAAARPAAAATRPGGAPAVAPPGTQVRVTPTGTAPVARAATSAGAGGNPPLSDAKLRAVFDAYVTAKKRCQEDTSKLSYDQVAANLRKQVPELMKKANASSVEFKIVIKDGKAVLRAIPK